MLDLLTFISLNFLAAISPGPDFAIVAKFGLTGSRKSALLASAGISLALFIHVFYCMSGVAVILQKNPVALSTLKVLGFLYLGYVGVKTVLKKVHAKDEVMPKNFFLKHPFIAGLLTNLLNPKSTFFCLSLLIQFAHAYTTFSMKIAFGLSVPLIAISWYSFVSYSFTHPRFIPFIQKQRASFTKGIGLILIFLSVAGFISLI